MSTVYTIRPLTREDEPFLWEMVYHAIFVPPGQEPPSREIVHHPKIASYVERWGGEGDMGCGAVDSSTGQLVGAAWLRLLPGYRKGYGYIADGIPELTIALLPGHRGLGAGTAMLERLLEMAADQYAAVSLSVSSRNPARRLYRRMGFIPVASEGTAIIMQRNLASSVEGTTSV